MPKRTYSDDELRALRTVGRHAWNVTPTNDPRVHGPAQWAGGDYWPTELFRRADEMERRASRYRIAAEALRREIQRDPLTTEQPDGAHETGDTA